MNSYTLTEQEVFIDNDPLLSEYGRRVDSTPYRIKDLPLEKKPRERLIKYGPESLQTNELLAIVLGQGTKKEEVMKMASRMLTEYGKHSLVSQRNVRQMATDLAIPLIKASQVVACAELGRRFFEKQKIGPALIRTPKDVFEYFKEMRDLPKEHLRGMYLNSHHRVIHDEVISIGTINTNIVHPREVFRPALEYSAAAVILAHNHPSNSATPSAADIEVTQQLVEAGKILGIELLDHVIITKTKFSSIVVDTKN